MRSPSIVSLVAVGLLSTQVLSGSMAPYSIAAPPAFLAGLGAGPVMPRLAFITQVSAPVDVWAPLRFLLGTWNAVNSGEAGEGTSRREYRLVMGDRYIETRNTATYPPQPKNPKGEVHEDAGFISFDKSRSMFVYRQFHVEGFVNTYVAPGAPGEVVVFTSEAIENIAAGWRARETYRRMGADSFTEVFELAEPGKEFTVYSRATLTRVK